MKYFALSFLTILLSWLLMARVSFAEYQLPNFSSCMNPGGSVQADYPQGNHAIVGVQGLQAGSDQVFDQTNNNFTQCFCPSSGVGGIQTDWLAAGSISKEDQNVLITQGWVYISNGADWGLSNQPYLAKNTNFTCGGAGSSGGSNGGNNSSGSSGGGQGGSGGGANTGGNGGQGGEVLGISTLAGTGNPSTKFQVLLALLLATSLIAYGYKIQKGQK